MRWKKWTLPMPTDSNMPTRTSFPCPKGGFKTDEEEAAWLAQLIALRMKEGLAALGISVAPAFKSLDELLLLSLKAAGRRAVKEIADAN
jgi:hypothetical protein